MVKFQLDLIYKTLFTKKVEEEFYNSVGIEEAIEDIKTQETHLEHILETAPHQSSWRAFIGNSNTHIRYVEHLGVDTVINLGNAFDVIDYALQLPDEHKPLKVKIIYQGNKEPIETRLNMRGHTMDVSRGITDNLDLKIGYFISRRILGEKYDPIVMPLKHI